MTITNLREEEHPVTVARCARILGIYTATLRDSINAGQFPAAAMIRVGSITRVDTHILAQLIEANQAPERRL